MNRVMNHANANAAASRKWRAVGAMVAVIAASLAGLAAPAQALPEAAVMVADINPGSATGPYGSLAGVNGAVFFGANDGTNGAELWKAETTAAGATLVKDINPGTANSNPGYITNFKGTAFFRADDGVSGFELWKSDGTSAGTVRLADINPGAGSSVGSNPNLTVVGNALFFGANDGTHGAELWKTDGTAAGTVMVNDVNPGGSSSIGSAPYLIDFNGTLLFSATDGLTGEELWKSDGTAAGTVQVADINPGAGNSKWRYPVILNGEVVFRADDGTHGEELWKTDGTTTGTVMVLDYLPALPGYGLKPEYLTVFNGAVYFVGDGGDGFAPKPAIGKELFKSDGTAVGTVLVKDIYPGANSSDPPGYPGFAAANGILFFAATDGTSSGAGGRELWKTDGTTSGTVRVKDINPGTGSSVFGDFYTATANSLLYFAASDGTVGSAKGSEVWQSDGSATGTVRTADIRPGTASSTPEVFTNVGGTVYFTANDGTYGKELWRLNSAPVAAADSYMTNEDTTLTVGAPGVLANDTDAEGNPFTAGSASTPAHGSVILNPDGSFVYTPAANYNGPDSFTYVADDGSATSNVATVNITVTPVDDAPVAADDAYSINQDTPLSVAAPAGVLANDTDIDIDVDSLTAGSASVPAHGSVTLAADGSFTYTPAAGYTGPDSFGYTASDGHGGTDTATVSITIVAAGPTRLAVSDVTVVEGSSGGTTSANFVITRTGTNALISTVNVKTTNGTATTASNDYVAIPLTTVTFAPGETAQIVTAAVAADTFFEKNETFNLALSGAKGATILDGTGVATVSNDDSAPTLSVNDVTVDEGDSATTPSTFTVTRAGNTTGALTVKAKTTNGTAKSTAADYTALPATTLAFADGELTKTVVVDVTGDPFFEKNETFNVVLSSPVEALISDAAGVGTIVNDDDAPLLSVDDVSVVEGNSGTADATFTISRASNTSGVVTVKAKTSNGTATTASGDYVAYPTTVVTFADGQTSATVTVQVNGDTLHEANETFSLVLSYPTGATISDTTGKATIVNDD